MIKHEGSVSDTIPYLKQGEELRLYLKPNIEIQKQANMESVTQVSRVAVIKGQGQWKFNNIIGWQILSQPNNWALPAILIGILALVKYANSRRVRI